MRGIHEKQLFLVILADTRALIGQSKKRFQKRLGIEHISFLFWNLFFWNLFCSGTVCCWIRNPSRFTVCTRLWRHRCSRGLMLMRLLLCRSSKPRRMHLHPSRVAVSAISRFADSCGGDFGCGCMQSCSPAVLQSCKTARLQDCKNARLQECKNARIYSTATETRGARVLVSSCPESALGRQFTVRCCKHASNCVRHGPVLSATRASAHRHRAACSVCTFHQRSHSHSARINNINNQKAHQTLPSVLRHSRRTLRSHFLFSFLLHTSPTFLHLPLSRPHRTIVHPPIHSFTLTCRLQHPFPPPPASTSFSCVKYLKRKFTSASSKLFCTSPPTSLQSQRGAPLLQLCIVCYFGYFTLLRRGQPNLRSAFMLTSPTKVASNSAGSMANPRSTVKSAVSVAQQPRPSRETVGATPGLKTWTDGSRVACIQ